MGTRYTNAMHDAVRHRRSFSLPHEEPHLVVPTPRAHLLAAQLLLRQRPAALVLLAGDRALRGVVGPPARTASDMEAAVRYA